MPSAFKAATLWPERLPQRSSRHPASVVPFQPPIFDKVRRFPGYAAPWQDQHMKGVSSHDFCQECARSHVVTLWIVHQAAKFIVGPHAKPFRVLRQPVADFRILWCLQYCRS
jgi:hypothetical protein